MCCLAASSIPASDARHKRPRGPSIANKSKPDRHLTGLQLLQSNRMAEAANAFDQAIAASSNGGDTNLHANRAVALQSMNPPRLEEAVWSWQMAISREPPSTLPHIAARTHFAYAMGLHGLRRYSDAIEPLQRAYALSPAHFLLEAQGLECDCRYRMSGDGDVHTLEESLSLCEKAIASEVTAEKPQLSPRELKRKGLCLAAYNSGNILRDLGRVSEARNFLNAALMLEGRHVPFETHISQLHMQLRHSNTLPHGEGVLQMLWPTSLDDAFSLAALQASPFALISHVPGSNPPVAPMYTPVWLSSSTELAVMNEHLLKAVLHMMDEDPRGALFSNVGGWQSRGNFFEYAPPSQSQVDAIRALQLHVFNNVNSLLSQMGRPESSKTTRVSVRYSWANVNRKSDWNKEVRRTFQHTQPCSRRMTDLAFCCT